ncbi:hypothetical protein C8034_v008701 [Colletotrichum sidae]|uniref:Uncharacterized protein n=1 Tax=Colletotrichum sidae TaxID=1347389 RepID=A0A4R8T286_9PEZI|nr:hypothetical protein C8034_v008701 [Colletotrichum sidae]
MSIVQVKVFHHGPAAATLSIRTSSERTGRRKKIGSWAEPGRSLAVAPRQPTASSPSLPPSPTLFLPGRTRAGIAQRTPSNGRRDKHRHHR